jgi:hypothetical protein
VTPLGTHRISETARDMGRPATLIFAICAAHLVAGCSGITPYPNNLSKNLSVRTVTDSGAWLSHVRAAVDIHHMSENCSSGYEGTVQLGEALVEIGLPPDRWSYLVFVFDTASFLGNRNGTITYETLMRPASTYRYEAAVTYKNDIYNVTIREFPSDRSKSRELDRVPLSACRSSSNLDKKAIEASQGKRATSAMPNPR